MMCHIALHHHAETFTDHCSEKFPKTTFFETKSSIIPPGLRFAAEKSIERLLRYLKTTDNDKRRDKGNY